MMKKLLIGVAITSIIIIGGWLLTTSNFFISKSPNNYPFFEGKIINQDTEEEISNQDIWEVQNSIPTVHLITKDKDIGLELMPEDQSLGDDASWGRISTYGFGLEQLHYTGGYVYLLRSTFSEDDEKFDIWRFPVDKETFQRKALEDDVSIFDKNYFYQIITYRQDGEIYAELRRIKR